MKTRLYRYYNEKSKEESKEENKEERILSDNVVNIKDEISNKEDEDRKELGVPAETIIIYEPTRTEVTVRAILNVLLLLLGLGAIGGALIWIASLLF